MKSIYANELTGKEKLIDVRETNEYSYGHIPHAINVPLTGIMVNAESLLNKEEELYVVCASGGRSQMACIHLINLGFNVVNVCDGTFGYDKELAK